VSDFFGQVKSSLTADELGAAIARRAAPPPKQGVVEWAEGNLSIGNTAHLHGPYRTRETPYIREVLECFGDESVRRLSLVWAAQTAKTTAILAGMAYRLDQNPAPALWVMPSAHLARSFSKSRWLPMVESSDALKAHKPDNQDDLTILEQHFRGMSVYFVGSNSPANLSSRSIALLMMDEMDKFATQSGKEASPIQLAEARCVTFPNHLIVCTSTPTYENGAIWTEYMKGDRRRFFLPCLACGEWQFLEWKNVQWDKSAKADDGDWNMTRVAETTRYVCPKCGNPHQNGDKKAWLPKGQWRATEFSAEQGRRSYHLSSLYSPWRPWPELAVKYLQDYESPGGLQDFLNREMAEPWKPEGALISTQMIRDRVDASPRYTIGQPPDGKVLGRLMSIDVQQTEMWWLVRELHEDGSSYLLDYGAMVGWDGIMSKFREYKCYRGIVDAGYAAKTPAGVYDFVAKSGGLFVAAKGRTVSQGLREPYKFQQIVSGGVVLWAVQFDAHFWQARLYHDILRDGWGRWYLPRDIAKDYVSQLQGEALIEKDGQSKWQRLGPNHLADCEKMCLVLVDSIMAQFKATNTDPEQPTP
jgi:phage terminase large subunit GpA-like protein